jgi:hypothetical protein
MPLKSDMESDIGGKRTLQNSAEFTPGAGDIAREKPLTSSDFFTLFSIKRIK